MLLNCLLAAAFATTAQTPDWENPRIFEINKEKAHSYFISYNSEKDAIADNLNTLSYKLLNGNWKFNWSDKPADRALKFYEDNYDASQWKTIPVPSNWQMHGYGYAHYTNITYPFPKNAPFIPHSHNPVGQYKTSFNMPKDWLSREVFIHFGAVNSTFYLWVNGQNVGYSQDSKLPAEFNITRYLKQGENSLAVEVYQFSDGSYLEDQDFWRLAGIERDVFLHARPKLMVHDFFCPYHIR
ncbi:MAG: hypothetical protein HC896_14885 [Bacteroidales bacterium]|nr:hypothetical protein [Bacteroidales bacterium]